MAKPMRTNNPSEWTALDGVYIDEMLPPGKITGKGSAVVAIVGQFQMGEYTPLAIQSSGHLLSAFGSRNYTGYLSLAGKTFSNLVVQRVKSSTAKTAFGILQTAVPADSITISALYDGIYGNEIEAETLASTSGDITKINILLTWGSQQELVEDIDLASLPRTCTFAKLTKSAGATAIPAVNESITLTQGSDGVMTAADYVVALEKLEAYDGITIIFADSGLEDVNLGLLAHCVKMGDRFPIIHLPSGITKDAAKTEMLKYRNVKDRGAMAYPHLYQYIPILDKTVLTNPAAWAASVLSQIPEEWDPAISDAAVYLTGVKGLEFNFGRTDYIEMKNAGIMAFEFDSDIGYKIKSGITLSLDPALTMIFRRRMSDLITSDIGSGLKPYQNRPMNDEITTDILGAVTKYLEQMKKDKRIEKYLVDGDSMNTEASMANGEYHLLVQVKLFSSMRYIILHAQIGETVLITERSAA